MRYSISDANLDLGACSNSYYVYCTWQWGDDRSLICSLVIEPSRMYSCVFMDASNKPYQKPAKYQCEILKIIIGFTENRHFLNYWNTICYEMNWKFESGDAKPFITLSSQDFYTIMYLSPCKLERVWSRIIEMYSTALLLFPNSEY